MQAMSLIDSVDFMKEFAIMHPISADNRDSPTKMQYCIFVWCYSKCSSVVSQVVVKTGIERVMMTTMPRMLL